jgi:mRNA degradation ribonuclease J1/J2
MDDIIATHPGRLIIGTFSSQLERIMRIVEQQSAWPQKVLLRAAQ